MENTAVLMDAQMIAVTMAFVHLVCRDIVANVALDGRVMLVMFPWRCNVKIISIMMEMVYEIVWTLTVVPVKSVRTIYIAGHPQTQQKYCCVNKPRPQLHLSMKK